MVFNCKEQKSMHYVHDDPADRRNIETSITKGNTRLNLKGDF